MAATLAKPGDTSRVDAEGETAYVLITISEMGEIA
jgi:hypothetical protein